MSGWRIGSARIAGAWRAARDAARTFPDRSGSVAVTFGLSAMVLLGLVGGGIDYARLSTRRSQLQNAADAGVLAAGNYLKLAMSTPTAVSGVAEDTIRAQAPPRPESPYALRVSVDADKAGVTASVEETVKLAFGGLVGMPIVKLAVRSRVGVVGRMRLCMLALDPAAAGAFNLQKNARVTANNCSLYSNSSDPSGMVGGDNALARADTICSAGGFSGPRANFAPPPQSGCPVIADPLKDRVGPTAGPCATFPYPLTGMNARHVMNGNLILMSMTLDPGTYCGGLHISGDAVVTLRPGIYIFQDGPLLVDHKATLNGEGVSLYFAGDAAGLVFDKRTTVSLTAPTTGSMAGILMSEDRRVSKAFDPSSLIRLIPGDLLTATPLPLAATYPMRLYRIISDNTRTMLGTLYLPAGRVVIDAAKPVADQSAYTVIVAQQVNLYEGPNLYLNANYDRTSVPVPEGVGPRSGNLMLTQ